MVFSEEEWSAKRGTKVLKKKETRKLNGKAKEMLCGILKSNSL